MGLSVTALRQAIRRVERSIESEMIDSADDPVFRDPLVRQQKSQSDNRQKEKGSPGTGSSSPLTGDNGSGGDDGGLRVFLKESQIRMAVWLNSLSWKKTLTWYPEISNSHAVIIVR